MSSERYSGNTPSDPTDRRRFDHMLESGRRLEEKGGSFPTALFRSIGQALLNQRDLSQFEELTQLGERLATAREQELVRVEELQERIGELAAASVRLRIALPSPQPARSPPRAAELNSQLTELRTRLLATVVEEARELAPSLRGGNTVPGLDRARGTLASLVAASRAGEALRAADLLVELRHQCSEAGAVGPALPAAPRVTGRKVARRPTADHRTAQVSATPRPRVGRAPVRDWYGTDRGRGRPYTLLGPPQRGVRWGVRRGVTVGLALVVMLAAYSAIAYAHATPVAPTITVSGLVPQNVVIGQTATLTGEISGGIPVSAAQGTFSGYLIYFFYGQTNSTGALGFTQQIIAPPFSCSAADAVCAAADPFSFTHTYDHPGSFDVSFTVYDAAGDYAIVTDTVNVLPPTVSVRASSDVQTAAEDTPISFSASVTTAPASYESDTFGYEWNFGDNVTGWGNPISHAYTDAGNYVVTVRAFDNRTGAANQAVLSGIVITNPAPVPSLQVVSSPEKPGPFVEDAPVTFSAAGTTDVPSDVPLLRYAWSFGDGAVGAGISASHVYTEAGSYVVTLTVTDEENTQVTASTSLTIANPSPAASAADTSAAPVTVGTVGLLNGSATADMPTDLPLENYSWSTEMPQVTDMGSSYGSIGRDGYFDPGTYPANLLVTDEQGTSSAASTSLTVVDAPPNAGVYSMYTLANLSLAMMGKPGNTLNVSVFANGLLVAGGDLTRQAGPPSGSVLVLTNVPFYLADGDTIVVSYVPPTSGALTGANPVDLTLDFWGDGGGCTAQYPASVCAPQVYTHIFNAKQVGGTSWDISGNIASLGQLVFLNAQVFSPARTSLSTTWSFGDGASATSSTFAPALPGPTVADIATTHRWLPGANYAFTLSTVDAYGSSNSSTIEVSEVGDAAVSDIAPTVSLEDPTTTPAAPSTSLFAAIASQDFTTTAFGLSWHFGDGGVAGQSGVGTTSSIAHFFRYSATEYAVVVYAFDRVGGPSTVSWAFLTVENAPPVPSFTGPGTVSEFELATFNASASVDYLGAAAGGNLSYAWTFGDGVTPDTMRGAGETVSHIFTTEGTFPVTLTVTDDEGLSASTSQLVTVEDVPVTATLSSRTVTVDEFTTFGPSGVSGAPSDVALMNGVWSWGDGTPTSTGLTQGHTYSQVGQYTQVLQLFNEDGSPLDTLTSTVTVVDQPLSVVLPYEGFTVYGENHTATFEATVMGSPADASAGPTAFTYVFDFGDGSPVSIVHGGLSATVDHVYSLEGNPKLSVTVAGPNGVQGSASATLISVPNWDGDGIPDAYASLLLGLPAGNDPSTGTGLTDFMSAFVVHGTPTNADTDHDGLTDFQEVFGTVTGYVSNPLDPNTAGDGILDGSHQFVDSFHSNQVVQFSGSGSVTIPGVQHPLDSAAISKIELYTEIVSPQIGSLSVGLQDQGPGGLVVSAPTVSLGTATSPVMQFTLLTNTPTGGPASNYSFSIPQFQSYGLPSTWVLSVSGGSGTIESASILITYYTNPNLADPFGTGLTLGNGFSIPVFNCTEPTAANYTIFHGTTMTYSTVDYYPYSEQYAKLSIQQGLPYYPWDNSSYTGGTGCGVSDPQAFASYYGDRQFGVSPWQLHPVDPVLTNGMKAYGKTIYDETANHYLSASSGTYVPSVMQVYPLDPISYGGPLNPTAASTGTNGVVDSSSQDPVGGPVVLGVSLGWATSNCISIFDFGADSNAGGVVQIQDANYAGSPSMYTPSVGGSNDYKFGDTCIHWSYYFGVNYQLPVDPSASSITINLALYQQYSLKNGAAATGSYTFSATPGTTASYSGQFDVTFSVFRLDRMPVVLLNSSREVLNLPGYGYRWVGDQHFYAFYLTLSDSGAGTPFHAGENLLLVSRTAFVNSSLNASLAGGDVSSVPYLSGASFSDRSSSSALAILGTLTATLSSSDANLLLAALIPHNATGATMGAYEALGQVQFELLGLDPGIMSTAPYLPLAGYNSAVGIPPTNFWQALGNLITSVVDAIVSVVLAIGNFIVHVAEEIGQAILGAWNAVKSAVEAAVNAIVSAFDFVVQWIKQKLSALFDTIGNAIRQGIGKAIEALALPFLSLLVDMGAISSAQFSSDFASLDAAFNLTDPSPLNNETAGQQVATMVEILTGIIAGLFAIVGIVMYVIDVVSLGTAAAETEAASAAADGVVAGIVASVFGAIGGLAGIFGVLTSIVPSFQGTDAFSNFFSFLNNNVTGQLGSNIVQLIVAFLVGVTDLIKTVLVAEISGAYIVGIALGIVALILGGFAAAFPSDVLAQLILSAFSLVIAAASVIVQFYPLTQAADDASETGIADAAGIVMGVAGAILSITTLTQAAETCASNTTACSS